MAKKTSFEYELKAMYTGATEFAKMRRDIEGLSHIESMRKITADSNNLRREFVAAKGDLKALSVAMKEAGSSASVQLKKDYAAAEQAVKSLSGQLEKNSALYKKNQDALEQLGVNTKQLNNEHRRLTSTMKKDQQVFAARRALGVRAHVDIKNEIKALSRAYIDLSRSGKASMVELARAKDNLKRRVGALTQEMRGVPAHHSKWASGLDAVQHGYTGILATVGAIATASQGIMFYASFDDVMRTVKAVSGATDEELQNLREYAKELGSTTRFTSTQVAESMQVLAQMGLKTGEIFATLPSILNLSAASNLSLADAADKTMSIIKQFNLEVEDAGRVADVITQGFTKSSASAEDLSLTLSYIGPIANDLGYSLEDTVGMIGLLADAGFKSERAGTALRGGISRLIKPVGEAKEVIKKYGLQITDSEGRMRPFADIMDDLGKAGLSSREKIALFGLEAGPGMSAALSQGADKLREYEEAMNDAAGRAKEIAEDKEGGPGGAIRALISSIQGGIIKLGEVWEPVIVAATKATTGFFRVVNELPDPIIMITTALGGAYVVTTAWTTGLKTLVVHLLGGEAAVFAKTVKVRAYTVAVNQAVVANKKLIATMGLYAAAGYVAYQIFDKTLKAAEDLREAEMKASNSAADLAKKKFALSEKMRAVAKDTGLVYDNIVELNKAITNGTVQWDDYTKKWVAGSDLMVLAAEQAAGKKTEFTDEALDAMRNKWQEHVDEVNRLQDQILDREKKQAAELRALARKSMDEGSAWGDRKAEAQEFANAARQAFREAQRALNAGDQAGADKGLAKAVQLADQARGAYRQLSESVSEAYEVAADAAKKSASTQQRVTRKAIDAVRRKYEQYAAKVKSLQDDIAGREKSLAEQLREIGRSTMGEYAAWKDRKAEAEEYTASAKKAYEEARRALLVGRGEQAEGFFAEAVELADKARQAYADLNSAVSEGDTVWVSQEKAAKVAGEGVKEAGKLAIQALKDQEAAAQSLAKTAAGTYSNLAQQYNADQQKNLTSAMKGMEDAGKLAVDVLREQEKAAQDAAEALDQEVGGAFSREALQATGQELESINDEIDDIIDTWSHGWNEAEEEAIRNINEIKRELDKIKDKTVTVTVKKVETEAKQSGGMVGSFQKMAAGGPVAQRFAAVGYRNMINGGRIPGFGGGDRRWILGEDGEVMINKDAVREAGSRAALAFNAKQWGVVISELTSMLGQKYKVVVPGFIKARTGGMMDGLRNASASLPKLPPVNMQFGGAVASGGGGTPSIINLQLFPQEEPVQVSADKVNTALLLKQINQYKKYRS